MIQCYLTLLSHSAYPADDSCSVPSSRHRNIPLELWEKVLRVTESSQQTERGHSAPLTSSEDNSDTYRQKKCDELQAVS